MRVVEDTHFLLIFFQPKKVKNILHLRFIYDILMVKEGERLWTRKNAFKL